MCTYGADWTKAMLKDYASKSFLAKWSSGEALVLKNTAVNNKNSLSFLILHNFFKIFEDNC